MGNKPLLSIEQRTLLDRLYNLKSEDSEILRGIKADIDQTKTDFQVLSGESTDLETQKTTLSTRRGDLDSQYAKILEDLKGMSRESYATLLDEAHEEFDPEQMLERIKEKIPNRLKEIDEQISNFEKDIDSTKKKIADNEIKAKELEGRLSDAIQMQERLAKLISESLHGNGSITRDSVQDLLLNVGFLEEETIELGKMILFPQGTLSEYDKEYQERQNRGKSIQEVFESAKAAQEYQPSEPEAQKVVETEPVVVTESEPINEEDFSDFLKETGINPEYYNNEILNALKSANCSELIKDNMNFLQSLEISDKTIARYYMLLTDQELISKVNYLQEQGKSSKDIELGITILLAYSYADLIALKNACDEYGLEFNNLPLNLIATCGLANLLTNLQELNNRGIELDKMEISKFSASLFIDPEQFKNNLELIVKYQLSLTKRNSKVAIQALASETMELARGIDALIEINAEKVLENNPEVLSGDLIGLVNRILYCQEHNIPVYKDNGALKDYIISDLEFKLAYGIETPKLLPSFKESVASLSKVTNESTLIEILNKMDFTTLYLGARNISDENTYFDLMTYTEAVNSKSERNEYGYEIDGTQISRERFERNIIFLLNQHAEASQEEMMTVALLFGTLKTEEEMKRVADKMGFNLPAVGGVTL